MTNQIVMTGNLGGPVKLEFTKSGRAVANFSLADTPRRRNQHTNEWENAGETLWARCTIWGAEAEAFAEAAGDNKGRVTVVGRAGWETFTKRDGTEGSAFTITATAASYHPPKDQSGGQGYDNTGQFTQAPADDPWGGGGGATPPF